MNRIEEVAQQVYEFVHRGKVHMTWAELPHKYGKKAYYEVARQIDKYYCQLFPQPLTEMKVLVDGEWVTPSKEFRDTVAQIDKAISHPQPLDDEQLGWRIDDALRLYNSRMEQRLRELSSQADRMEYKKHCLEESRGEILALLQPKIEEAFNEGVEKNKELLAQVRTCQDVIKDLKGNLVSNEEARRQGKVGFGLRQLQVEAREWVDRNFPNGKPHHPFFGIVEEIGELAHAHLKREQGIRTEENHPEKQKDAIGDIVVFLADYCNRNGFDLEKCVRTVWAEVKQRNWQALSGKGGE